jgi:hypothetical protein
MHVRRRKVTVVPSVFFILVPPWQSNLAPLLAAHDARQGVSLLCANSGPAKETLVEVGLPQRRHDAHVISVYEPTGESGVDMVAGSGISGSE